MYLKGGLLVLLTVLTSQQAHCADTSVGSLLFSIQVELLEPWKDATPGQFPLRKETGHWASTGQALSKTVSSTPPQLLLHAPAGNPCSDFPGGLTDSCKLK